MNYSILCFLAVTLLLSCGEKKLEATVELDTKKPIHTIKEYTVGPATNLSKIDSFYLSKIADTQYLMNKKRNFNAAIALLEEAKSLGEFEEAQKEIQSDVWLTLGNVAFVKGMFEDALSYYIEGMDIRETMTRLTHGSVLGYRSKASILQNLARFEEAMENHEKALSIAKLMNAKTDNKFWSDNAFGVLYKDKGSCLAQMQDYDAAETYLLQAKKLIQPGNTFIVPLLGQLAQVYEHKNKRDEAVQYFRELIDLTEGKPKFDLSYQQTKYNLISYEYVEHKDQLIQYKKFLNELPSDIRFYGLKQKTIITLASLYEKEGDFDKALQILNNGLNAVQAKNDKDKLHIARFQSAMAELYSNHDKVEESLEYYRLSISNLFLGYEYDPNFVLPSLEDHRIINKVYLNISLNGYMKQLFKKYNASKNVTDLDKAFDLLSSLDEVMDVILEEAESESSKFGFVKRHIEAYEVAIKICIEKFRVTQNNKYLSEAYKFASKNKAVLLHNNLQYEEALKLGLPAQHYSKVQSIQDEIHVLEREITGITEGEKVDSLILDSLSSQKFRKAIDYNDLIARLELEYPKYYQLKNPDNSPLSYIDVQQHIPDNTLLIEFFVGLDSIYTFSYSNNSDLHFNVEEKTDSFALKCKRYRYMLAQDSVNNLKEYGGLAYELYDLLLKNTLSQFENSENINRLIIIPDDELLVISFDGLLTTTIEGQDKTQWTSKLPYLIRDFAISTAYSNRLISEDQLTDKFKKSNQKYVGFGLEYNEKTLEAIDSISPVNIDSNMTRKMGKLYFSKEEILESASIFDGNSFINEEATKEKFLSEGPSAAILHLAAHGYVMRDKPMNSGIILSKTSPKDTDYIIKAIDIYGMELSADIAVLSACHTGDGLINKGEGIRSLARAFYYAGCPNVTASLWAAPDYSTKNITVNYFKYIKTGLPKDVSLQRAKLDYLDNCEFNKAAWPCNWSHLITTGDQRKIALKRSIWDIF